MKSKTFITSQKLFQTSRILVSRPLGLDSWHGKIEQYFAAFIW